MSQLTSQQEDLLLEFGSSKIVCLECGREFDNDEVVGNAFDGYICFECSEENLKGGNNGKENNNN